MVGHPKRWAFSSNVDGEGGQRCARSVTWRVVDEVVVPGGGATDADP
jgi:hypothetical protein